MKQQTRDTLELIIEKANKLRDFQFEKHIFETSIISKFDVHEDGIVDVEFGMPQPRETDSFILTFRLFYQTNEKICLKKIPILCSDPGLSIRFTKEANQIYKEYNAYLKDRSPNGLSLYEGKPTREQMINAGLYGGRAHVNSENTIANYRLWTRNGVRKALFEQEFARFLIDILGFINRLSNLCQSELENSK
ncbi:MAG: hypothetical protein P4L50_05395 [Anaerolineaceae bacterium]|nr:hypothetical protein [Anaerolineaceae bacterium]